MNRSPIAPRSEPHRIFGLTIKAIRQRTFMTQMDVSARMGVSKKSIAEYEQGTKAPGSWDRLNALCAALLATEDERTALTTVWGDIGSHNRIAHFEATSNPKPPMDDALIVHPVDFELRALQDLINAVRSDAHDDAPFVAAGLLNCVAKITAQGARWLGKGT